MTALTIPQQIARLARLAGEPPQPVTGNYAYVLVRLITQAKTQGKTWAQIAAAAGAHDGKAAKRWAHALARQAQRDLLARDVAASAARGAAGAA